MKVKNISDLKNADTKYNLKKISEGKIKTITIDDFWDGPLSGECAWQNKSYYFQCFDQIDPVTDTDIWPRKYLLLTLSDQQMNENRRLQKLFERSADSESLRDEYIKTLEQTPGQVISQEQIIGWFDSDNLE
jgi:hypothetical protein